MLPFEIRKLPNHPLIRLKIGGIDFLGAFDTGQQGSLSASKATLEQLAERKWIAPTADKEGPFFDIENVALSPSFTVRISAMHVSNKPSPAAVPIGIPEENIIHLGYAFLSQYKTIWDFNDRKIYLLKRGD